MSKAQELADALMRGMHEYEGTTINPHVAAELRRLEAENASLKALLTTTQIERNDWFERSRELLGALKRMMKNHSPLSGNQTHAELVDFWEYEKTQGRGEADDQLFALAAIQKHGGQA